MKGVIVSAHPSCGRSLDIAMHAPATSELGMSAWSQSEQSPGASGSLKRSHESAAEDVKVWTSSSPTVLVVCIDPYCSEGTQAGL